MARFNFSSENCKNCYKCVRICSVKAIKVKNNKAEIDEEKCIACGQCFVVCPKHSRNIENDVNDVANILKGDKKVVACIDSTYIGVYEKPGKFISALKKIGFNSVEEVAVGAAAITDEYINYIEKNKSQKYIISSSCPSVYLYIKKYHPEAAEYLMPVVTPMLALGKAIKKENPDCYTVFIGPCLSKKYETNKEDESAPMNYLITFDEVNRLFKHNFIDIDEMVEIEPDRIAPIYGEKYSIAGDSWENLTEALDENNFDFFRVDGLDNVRTLFELVEKGELEKSYIGISACHESCVMGPFIPKKAKNVFSRKQIMKSFANNGWKGKDNISTINWSDIDLYRKHIPKPIIRRKATDEEIEEVLRSTGKFKRIDELNCGACGYDTCREKAQAVIEGMAEVEMCMPYMRTKAENMSDIIFLNSRNIIMLINEELNIKQFNPVAERSFEISQMEVLDKPVSTIMDDTIFKKAFEIKKDIMNIKIHLDSYGIVVAANVIYIDDAKMLFVSLQNITEDEKRRQELDELKRNTLEIAQNVIEKQMRVAQEVASLLGETTAETKVALNKLKYVVMKEESQ